MFEKLLANLPYNPNLTKQISFYARRMRHEESIRRTGLVFIVLAFMVQFFAFMSPPAATTAYSSSDMINGGISSKADAVSACRQNVKNYGDALSNFGVRCSDIADSSITSVRSTDFNNQLFSMSWLPYGQTNPHSGKPTDETAYNLTAVAETMYARRLISADTIPFSTYQVLKGTNKDGHTFFIMFGCGNLMTVGTPNISVEYGVGHVTTPAVGHVEMCALDNSIPKDSKRCKPCKYDSSVLADSPKCKPCKGGGSNDAQACIVEHKTAANRTQGIANADGTTAKPNDIIVYTLFAENTGKAAVKDFAMQENLSDVLDYATVTDLHGGKQSKRNVITWPSEAIKPGSTLTHKISVRVQGTLSNSTPTATDPYHFDHVMTNVYGNAVNIKLPITTPGTLAPITSTTVSSSEALPNTGPGSGLVLAGSIVVVAGYFFARARLLVDESMILVQEATTGGL